MSSRSLYVDALEALLKGPMAKVALSRNFELLREIAKLAQSDAPVELAVTDPTLFASWRAAVTRYHAAGWTNMTPDRVSEVVRLVS
jgi:predicted ATPase